MPAARCMLQGACCKLPAARCLLQGACCKVPAAKCLLQGACCKVPAARCCCKVSLQGACCKVPAASCLLQGACCKVPAARCLARSCLALLSFPLLGCGVKAMLKADSTLRTSRAVPHPSTNRALRRLTSEVGRDPVHSTRYGRQRMACLHMYTLQTLLEVQFRRLSSETWLFNG